MPLLTAKAIFHPPFKLTLGSPSDLPHSNFLSKFSFTWAYPWL
jgi:hypothetical protein